MVYHYTLLCAIIHYYCAIIHYYCNYCNYCIIIRIIVNNRQCNCNYLTIIRGWSENFSAKQTSGMGNTPRVSCWRRVPAAWSPRSVIDMDLWFLGSAHGVPTDPLCLRWQSMACRESNSFLQWTHLKPNAIGNRLGPSGFPLPAPRRMLWVATSVNSTVLISSNIILILFLTNSD